jgi:hypothetical protein
MILVYPPDQGKSLFKETLKKSSPRRKPWSSSLIFLDAGYRIKSGTDFAGMTNIQEVP